MFRKVLLFCVFLLITTVCLFSEDDDTENSSPKNTITIDTWLTGSTFLAWGITGNPILGTAVQYERQLSENISAAGRLEYRGMGLASIAPGEINLSSFSVEGHVRYFPGKNVFFLDGMLGYALFNYKLEAENSLLHFFKYGGRLGWRIDFGKPGGFVLEPSFGYYGAVGKNSAEIDIEESKDLGDFLHAWLNLMNHFLIHGYFVGGFQMSLGLGYRF